MNWRAVKSWWRSHGTLRNLYLLVLGQLVSLVLALMSFTSSLIASLGVDAPLTQSLFIYLSLVLVYGSILLYRRQGLRVSWYWYILLAFVDVHGNYFGAWWWLSFLFHAFCDNGCPLKIKFIIDFIFEHDLAMWHGDDWKIYFMNIFKLVNKAFQFSSITSVTLLDCWTVAWVIVLTWIVLGTRYSLWQLFGAAICVAGLGLVLLSDAGVGGGGGSKPLLGDTLVILGTIFFALSNVGEEFCVKKKDQIEVVSMIGVFGFLVTLCEIPSIELKSLESVRWTTDIVLSFAGYAMSGFMFYTLVPYVLKLSGATMFNLSILTADMWAVVFRIFFYHQKVDWLYYISFVVVVIGLVIYSVTEKDPNPVSTLEDGDASVPYQVLVGENGSLAS